MNNRSLVEQAVKTGIESYANSRRKLISPFIEKNFSFKGAWQLNKHAFGKDLWRAPANLVYAPFVFLAKVCGIVSDKVGFKDTANYLQSLPSGFRTDVEQEIEWLLYSEFLELPYESAGRACKNNALLTYILAENSLVNLFEETLHPFAGMQNDSTFRSKLEEKLSTYVDNRKDVSELTTALMAISAGLAANK